MMHPESSMPAGVAERFAKRRLVVVGECWVWAGTRTKKGYGLIGSGPKGRERRYYAHRVAWTLAHGAPIPPGLVIAHTCDNPACVRNDDAGFYVVDGIEYRRYGHLFLTPPVGNTRDMLAKGRHRFGPLSPAGEQRRLESLAKLSARDAVTIVHRAAAGESSATLAAVYRVSKGTINAVRGGYRWGRVTADARQEVSRP